MVKIAPSILSADFTRLGGEIAAVQSAGADYLHIDVMDGHFVPNLSIGVPVVKSLRKCTKMAFDVHLMIANPEKYIRSFAEAGADILNFHIEAARDPGALIDEIARLGKIPAITVKPETEVEKVYPFLGKLGMVLVMSVSPGFGGQEFLPQNLEKARKLKRYAFNNNLNFDIEMDGGVTLNNLREVVESGVNVIVAGTAIFGGADATRSAAEFKARANLYRFRD